MQVFLVSVCKLFYNLAVQARSSSTCNLSALGIRPCVRHFNNQKKLCKLVQEIIHFCLYICDTAAWSYHKGERPGLSLVAEELMCMLSGRGVRRRAKSEIFPPIPRIQHRFLEVLVSLSPLLYSKSGNVRNSHRCSLLKTNLRLVIEPSLSNKCCPSL